MRIDATIPTLKHLLSQSAELRRTGKRGMKAIVLICHLGRPPIPGGRFERSEFSLEPCVEILEDRLGLPIRFLHECVGDDVEKEIAACEVSDVCMCVCMCMRLCERECVCVLCL
jgi:phosphoglycerate kinase